MEKIFYEFDDSMFPQRELIIDAVNDAGFDLDSNYTGSSQNPVLASIFRILISQGNLDILETQTVEVPATSVYPMEKATIKRYGMSSQQARIFERLVRMGSVEDKPVVLNRYSFDVLNYVANMVLFSDKNSKKGYWFAWDVSAVFSEIQLEWHTRYGLNTLAPVSFVENYFLIDEKVKLLGLDKVYSDSKNLFPNGLRAAVKVAFMFSPETVENLVKNGLTAETIMGYIDSGIGSSQEILEWSENMPAEWFTALIGQK